MFQNQLNDQFSQAQTKAVENAKYLAQVAVESAQELSEINQAAAKDALVAAQEASTQLMAIKDPQQLTKLAQPEVAQEAAKYASAYQAKVNKVVRNGNKEVAQLVDASIDDTRAEMVKFVKEATKQLLLVQRFLCLHSKLHLKLHSNSLTKFALQQLMLSLPLRRVLTLHLLTFKVNTQ